MKRSLALAAAVIAAFTLTMQNADAGGRRHVDKRVAAVAIGMGAASTAVYFGINNWKWNDWSYKDGLTRFGAWGATTLGCAAISPMVATVVVRRPLTQREGHVLIGSCVVPIVGGWLVNEAYNAHPEWEAGEAPVRKVHRKRKAK
ncbi:MAG: hypothetical protein PSV22_23805 [Pseudolabrys sp.]|nr:hypothetical protein [Pseudolabrys sp.]